MSFYYTSVRIKMKSVTFYENNVQIYQYNGRIIVQNIHKKYCIVFSEVKKNVCKKIIKKQKKKIKKIVKLCSRMQKKYDNNGKIINIQEGDCENE